MRYLERVEDHGWGRDSSDRGDVMGNCSPAFAALPSESLAQSHTENLIRRHPSVITLRGFDTSSNISRAVATMDTEDSPWGGMRLRTPSCGNIYVPVAYYGNRCTFKIKLECQSCKGCRV